MFAIMKDCFLAMSNVDIVIHAAALKQVPVANIIRWNVLGQILMELKML